MEAVTPRTPRHNEMKEGADGGWLRGMKRELEGRFACVTKNTRRLFGRRVVLAFQDGRRVVVFLATTAEED